MAIGRPTIIIGTGNNPNLNPIPCVELFEDYKPSITNGPSLSKKYWCDYKNGAQLCNQVLGLSTGSVGSGTINRLIPHQCPEFPNLYAASAEYEGRGPYVLNNGRPTWTDAVVTVNYVAANYNVEGTDNLSPDGNAFPFCTINMDYSSEFYTAIGQQMRYAGGSSVGKPLGQDVNVKIASSGMNIKIHQVPYFPLNLLLSKQNDLNDDTFLGQAAGLWRFDGGKTTEDFDSLGNRTMSIDLTFKWRQWDWNYVPDLKNFTTFVPVTTDGTSKGSTFYSYSDLTPLLLGVTLD